MVGSCNGQVEQLCSHMLESWSIKCSVPGCDSHVRFYGTMLHVGSKLSMAGWKVIDGKVYCENCSYVKRAYWLDPGCCKYHGNEGP